MIGLRRPATAAAPAAVLAAVLAVVVLPARAGAQQLAPRDDQELSYDLKVDLTITLVGAAAWIATELQKDELLPAACAWCADNDLDAWVRDGLLWEKRPDRAHVLSNIGLYGVVPAAALGGGALAASHDGRIAGWGVDVLVIAEATVVATDLNQLVKFLVRRERPFVHALPDGEKPLTTDPADNNLSFFSGHTTTAFALATAAGTVAWMRGYRRAPLVWGVALAAAATTSYLRLAADKHYFTDVLTGAVVGAGVGFAVPYLFHQPRRRTPAPVVSTAPLPGGGLVSAAWTW